MRINRVVAQGPEQARRIEEQCRTTDIAPNNCPSDQRPPIEGFVSKFNYKVRNFIILVISNMIVTGIEL